MKTRIISAIVALIISIPLVYVGGMPFYFLAIIIALLGFKEILDLLVKNYWNRLICYISYLFLLGTSINENSLDNIFDFKVLSIVLLTYGCLLLINHKNKEFNVEKCFYLIGISVLLAISFSTLIIIRNMNLFYFIYLFLITIMTDTFAQSTGILFGKHKINEISPNKTWEGCLGGTFFGVLISILFYLFFINQEINLFLLIFVTTFLSMIGQLGDLFFSQIKRYYKIKDFSNIMPGHGGILDRFDSIIFVSLAIIYFINFL